LVYLLFTVYSIQLFKKKLFGDKFNVRRLIVKKIKHEKISYSDNQANNIIDHEISSIKF